MNEPIPTSDPEEKLFGEMLVKEGLVKPEQVRECFVLQDELRARKVSPLPKLGELLRQKGYLTPEAYQETVTLGVRPEQIESESLEEVPLPPEVVEAVRKEENRFGKYVRVSPLGSGGMGEVWKAWDTDLGRWVALKFLKAANPDNLFRFRREAQTAGQIDHPHIAAIYEVGEKSGSPFIAMQYVEGVTLTTFPRNDIRELVRLMRDTALAVHAAHEKGIIHRDLKPDNIMIAQKESSHVYVMDFGLAKETSVDTSISQTGLVLGTPSYMSPEQAQGKAKSMDARSDIYSLGATLYELCTGHPPFQDNEVLELLRKVVETDPPPIRKENPEVESDLETIVLKCLRKEPGKRYPTAAALAADLGNYLAGESIAARPMGRVEKVSRWTERNKGLAGTLAALLLFPFGGVLYYRIDAERDKAREIEQIRSDVTKELKDFRGKNGELKDTIQSKILSHRNPVTVAILVKELDTLTSIVDTKGDLNKDQARYLDFICETLGLLRIHERAVNALGRYLETEKIRHQDRAIPAGEALCSLGGEEAERVLLRARDRFDPNGYFWQRMRRIYGRLQQDAGLETGTLLGYVTRGSLRHEKGDLDGAIEDFTYVLERNPKEGKAWINRGSVRADKGDLDGAIEDFTHGIKLDPTYSFGWNNRGNAKQKMGDLAGAIEDYTKALQIKPDLVHALHNRAMARINTGDFAGGIRDSDRALKINPKYAPAWVSLGIARQEQDDWEGALSCFTRAVEIDPNSEDGWYNRGNIRKHLGDLNSAISDYTKAIDLNPKYVKAWINRGRTRQKKRDLDGAIFDFTRAVEIDPKQIDGWINRGILRNNKRDFERAIEDFTKALQLDSKHVVTLNNRGIARARRGEAEKAILDFSRAIEFDPEYFKAFYNRGFLYQKRGNLKRALKDYDIVLKISPKYVPAWVNRGNIRQTTGHFKEAISDYTRAIKYDPKHSNAWFNRGLARSKNGDLDGAIKDFTRLLTLDPDYVQGWYSCGFVRRKKGDLAGAIHDWQQFLKRNPTNPKAPEIRSDIKKMRAQLEKQKEK